MFMRVEVVNSLRGVYYHGSQHLILDLWCVKLQEWITDTNLIDYILTVINRHLSHLRIDLSLSNSNQSSMSILNQLSKCLIIN